MPNFNLVEPLANELLLVALLVTSNQYSSNRPPGAIFFFSELLRNLTGGAHFQGLVDHY